MSQKEFQRVKVIESAIGGRLSLRSSSRRLQLSERQVQRLKCRYQSDSVAWVQSRTLHALGGFASPEAVDLDLGPGASIGASTILIWQKKLRDEEDLSVGRQTVRRERPTGSAEHSRVTVATHLAQLNDPARQQRHWQSAIPGLKTRKYRGLPPARTGNQ